MNRRQILKGAAAASFVTLSLNWMLPSEASAPKRQAKAFIPSATDMKVLFYGLWAFWHGQLNPIDGREGVLAFSPDFEVAPEHSYTAKFKSSSSGVTLEPGIPYAVALDRSSAQTQVGLWNAVQAHDAGLFLHTKQGGNLVVRPLPPEDMRKNKARTIWLPYPDDISPAATIDLRKQTLFNSTQDLTNADLKNRWPMIQVFSYSGSKTVALTDGIATVTGKVNLHVITKPVTDVSDMGQHAAMAWKALMDLIPKANGQPLDISFSQPLSHDMGVCSDPMPGVDMGDDIPDPCTEAGGTQSHLPTANKALVHVLSNPSNCAAGGGLEIGP